MTSFSSSFEPSQFSVKAIQNMNPLNSKEQKFLSKIYSTVAISSAVYAASAYISFNFFLPRFITLIATILLMPFTLNRNNSEKNRLMGLFGIAFLMGNSSAPLLKMAVEIDPTLIFQAGTCTVLLFACFSIFSLFSPKRSMLFMGGFLSTSLTTLFWTTLIGRFFFPTIAFNLSLYFGLLIFCGYIIYDTQLILAKFERDNNADYISGSLQLFVDLIGVFIRILVILMKNKKKKSSSNRKK